MVCDSISEYIKESFKGNAQNFRNKNYKITDNERNVFKVWINNNKRTRKVHNLEKTKKYFGLRIYMFCKKYNISSCCIEKLTMSKYTQ